jgi:tRNA-modifying protein YgfZ
MVFTNERLLATPMPDRTAIIVRGGERMSWLNGLVTCELAKLGPTDGAYGLIVEKKGRIQTDFFLAQAARGDDKLALAVPRALREGLVATLEHYLVMEDAELECVDLAFFQLHGARAGDVAGVMEAAYFGTIAALGQDAVVAVAEAEARDFGERLTAAVRAAGGEMVDEETWEASRIERGLPRFGVEVDATFYPQEAGLEKVAVSFDKGCYLGQEVVYMLENRGHVKRKLVVLDLEGDGVPAKGTPVSSEDGAVVGDVKSSVIGLERQTPVAIAMVKWAQTKPGTTLRIDERVARVR